MTRVNNLITAAALSSMAACASLVQLTTQAVQIMMTMSMVVNVVDDGDED